MVQVRIFIVFTFRSFAYKLLKPSVEVVYTPTGSGAGQTAIKGYQVDFAGSDSVLKAADYQNVSDCHAVRVT